ncbi:MAG TPA: nitrate- and nitrite sensing domain-containing protein [Micromonosporaceae bacterium]
MRAKVIALLASLAALWGFAAYVTVREGLNLLSVTTLDGGVAQPQEVLLPALQEERRLTEVYLGSHSTAARDAMLAQRSDTDEKIAAFIEKSNSGAVHFAASDLLEQRLSDAYALMAKIGADRAAIDNGSSDRMDASTPYDVLIEGVLSCVDAISAVDDQSIAKDARTLIQLTRAREELAQEDAVLEGALAEGTISEEDYATFVQLVGAQRYLYTQAISELPPTDQAAFEALFASNIVMSFQALENSVIAEGPTTRPTVSSAAWSAAIRPVFEASQDQVLAAGDGVVARAVPVAIGVLIRLILAGVLGLVAVIASIIISVTTARRIVRQLERLRNAARDLASYRLPRVVERLQYGEQVDVKQEAPPLEFGQDEIGQVGEAFNQVQETAIQVAVEQAELRRSVRDVFLSLARRSQALLHRQLGLLDAMERRATDSEELAELFRIDHLATRMRRNAENLIVLSGATAGRAWRKPVPMVDVLRGALAEVEDYTRVTVLPVGNASLLGRAVGDVIHLLAELIENAVSFSPPQTTVRVGGSPVGYGFAIEIEDRGLGMTPEELAAANEQLRDPPEFRLTSTARLGLYVVGNLAERHGIRVRLTESPYGGTTAIVLLPGSIMAEGGDGEDPLDPSQLDSYRPAQLAGVGRHRLQSETERLPREREAATAVAEAPALQTAQALNGAGHEAPLFASPSNGVGQPTALTSSPVSPATTVPATTVPATAEPATLAEQPKLTPSGLPWRQRRPTGEPEAAVADAGFGPATAAPASDPTMPASDGMGPTHTGPRDPDVTRSMMASYRSGTLRGRSDAARLAEEEPTGPTPTEPPLPEPPLPVLAPPASAQSEVSEAPPRAEPPAPPPAEPPESPEWNGSTTESPQWTQSTPEMRNTEEGG